MNVLLASLAQPWASFPGWHSAGWTMLHFLWIGSLVAIVGMLARLALRRWGPNVRYSLSLTTLAALTVLPPGVAWWQQQHTADYLNQPVNLARYAATPSTADAGNMTVPESELRLSPNVSDPSATPQSTPIEEIHWTALLDSAAQFMPWLWLVGSPLTFGLLATGLVGSERLRRGSNLVNSGMVHQTSQRLRKTLGIARQVGVALCDRLAQPVLVGIVRPLILLPSAAVAGWSPEQLEMVLLHELAHVRRWDNLVNLLQRIVESLLFFHPAVWLVSRQVRRDREECCDALVIAHHGQPQQYAELLVNIAAKQNIVLPAGASAMARHPLAGRIREILKLEDEPMLVSRNTLGIVAMALAGLLVVALWQPSELSLAEEIPAEHEKQAVAIAESAEPSTVVLVPGNTVLLDVDGSLPNSPISGLYQIEQQGTLALGALYGRVDVKNKTLLEAEGAVQKHLQTILSNPLVQMTLPQTLPTGTKDSSLLFDGKPFDYWRDIWKNELKTENRTEAIRALAAFGRAGHGKEAAEVILDVTAQYDFSLPRSSEIQDLMGEVVDVLVTDYRRIPAESWMPRLIELIETTEGQKQRHWNALAGMLLWKFHSGNQDALPWLLKMYQNERLSHLRRDLITALVKADPEVAEPQTQEIVQAALKAEPPAAWLLPTLQFKQLDKFPSQFSLFFHNDQNVRATALRTISLYPLPPEVIDLLLEVLDDPQRADEHVHAIRVLGVAGNKAPMRVMRMRTVERLQEILREGDSALLGPSLVALSKLLRVKGKIPSGDTVVESTRKGATVSPERIEELSHWEELIAEEEEHLPQSGGFGGGGGFF